MLAEILAHYADPSVRRRITEYLGGGTLAQASCDFVSRCDLAGYENPDLRPPERIGDFLEAGRDAARSLRDHRSLIAHLDIEYVNFDFPAEPYLDLERTFAVQQPAIDAIERFLTAHGVAPLHLLTGRGHHFVWRIARDSQVFRRLARMGRLSPELAARYARPLPPRGQPLTAEMGRAAHALSLVLEHLAFVTKAEAAPRSRLPVELTAVAVGPVERGREMVSIDLSEFGDPLHTRIIRIPFTLYAKPWARGIADDPRVAQRIPRLVMIPLSGMPLAEALDVMRDPPRATRLASRTRVEVPDQSSGTERMIADYLSSDVAVFHRWFYSREQEPPDRWPATYDRLAPDARPPCAAEVLRRPNDGLLQPARIQLVTRELLARGWHPRHIAGLLRSKYERDHGWGNYWFHYDAGMRADFYTRLFAGLFFTGRDDLVDFNCRSSLEKEICPAGCDEDRMRPLRESLLQRRVHGPPADRPVDRLLL